MEDHNPMVHGVTEVQELWADTTHQGHDTQPGQLTETEIFDLDLKEIKKEAENILQKEHKLRHASKPHSTPLTLKWLEETYEVAEGVCIPRSALYLHYLNFCEINDTQPVNAASFGKIIRQQFPHLTTRRLGTRGQSKYHYYGIGIKETSPYYEVMYSKNAVQCGMEGRKENVRQMVNYSPRSKLGTLLPPFPEIKDLNLPDDVDSTKVSTFLMMYRTHCQRILDTVIRANFDEVESLLLHFWQGMPPHLVPLLETPLLVNLVGVCDCVLYKAVAAVLMPTVLQALPDSLSQVIRKFSRQLDDWLQTALRDLPDTLINMKFDLSRRFAQVLRRQTALNQLCQAARTVTHSNDIVCQMLEDWSHVDLNSICRQTLYTMDRYSEMDHRTIIGFYKEFEQLLEEHSPLESYTDWLDSLVDRCVVRMSLRRPGSMRKLARQFLLMWSCFGTRVIRDMTLHSAPSFGSFHLLHLMLDDYVLYAVENLHTQERANDLLRVIRGEMAPDERQYNTCSRVLSMLAGNNDQAYSYASQPNYYQRHSVFTGYDSNGSVTSGDLSNMASSYEHHQPDVTSGVSAHDKTTAQSENTYSSQSYNQNTYNHSDTYHGVISYNNYANYMQVTQKHSYDYRSGQKGDWSESSTCHKYNALISGTPAQNYDHDTHPDNSTNILNPDFPNQTYSHTASTLNYSSRPQQTHVQQGVIYTPYQAPNSTYTTDNNNSVVTGNIGNNNTANSRKRKLGEETYESQQQYTVS